jgi:hypothetical protein
VAGDVNGVEIVVFPTIIWTASSIWARCPRSRSCAELDVAARGGLRHARFAWATSWCRRTAGGAISGKTAARSSAS